jgi:hypothetical protein
MRIRVNFNAQRKKAAKYRSNRVYNTPILPLFRGFYAHLGGLAPWVMRRKSRAASKIVRNSVQKLRALIFGNSAIPNTLVLLAERSLVGRAEL